MDFLKGFNNRGHFGFDKESQYISGLMPNWDFKET